MDKKTQRALIALTIVNLALLLFTLMLQIRPALAEGAAPVLLRLITERGRPSVKISTSEESSGLTVAGPTNTKDTYVILQSKGAVSSLKLRSEGGHEQVLKPWVVAIQVLAV